MFKAKLLFMGLLALMALTSVRVGYASDPIYTSNRFTQVESERELIQFNVKTDGFMRAGLNDDLMLYVHPESLAIKVRNLTTKYVFSSTQDDLTAHQLNETWRHFVDSALTVEFMQDDGNLNRESLTMNNSTIDLQLRDAGFVADVIFGESGIEMTLEVMLEGADVVVTVCEESVVEPEAVQLVTLQVYPFFGATKEADVPGYMFIPDGAGALIRFETNEIVMQNPFRAMVYGDDLGVGSRSMSSLNVFHVSLPVFGMVHGVDENGFLAMIESGDFHAEIVAHTAGLFTEFNWITTVFHYRFFYQQPTTRDETRGPSVEMLQAVRNSFDVKIRFRMLSDASANYVGMALAYQEFLVERGMLDPLTESLPAMRLEFFGAEMREGLLFNQIVAMTRITDLPYFAGRLMGQAVNDLLFVYRGWIRGGMSNSFPNKSPFERRLGSRSEVGDVINELGERGISTFFHIDYSRNERGQGRWFGGEPNAQQINTRPILGNRRILERVAHQVHSDRVNFERYGMTHFALENTATYLTSTFNTGYEASRLDNLGHLETIMDALNQGEHRQLALYEPNAYAWRHTLFYFDIPMTSTGHLFTTDSVPFLHIVLSGHVNYYAPPFNFAAKARQDLLRMIDYGARPSFLLTTESAHLLGQTPSSYISTSEFDLWEQTVVDVYEMMSAVVEATAGAQIISREVLAPGVVQVGYSNSVVIFINYTPDLFEIDGIIVPAESWEVHQP